MPTRLHSGSVPDVFRRRKKLASSESGSFFPVGEGLPSSADTAPRSLLGTETPAQPLVRVGRRAGIKGASKFPKASATRELDVDGLVVELSVKRVKNVNLRVKSADGRVTVSAPPWVSESRVIDFVREKRSWIERRRQVLVDSPRVLTKESTPEDIAAWSALVKASVPPLIAQWEQVMGVKSQSVAYRNMTSRWGSCNPSTGRICINVQLANYPPKCLEYVVVHELCHLLERGHGERFKALMTQFMPDWKARRALLK